MSQLAIISKKKSGIQVAKNLEKLVEIRTEIIESPEVKDGLYDVEYRVAEAGTRMSIAGMTDEELTREISETIEFIVRDLGIKNWGGDDAAYDSARFLKMLREYYQKMSFKQVELAFELLMVGKLDQYLPKNGKGEADRGHYQSFDFQFISKVLNAFLQYDRTIWGKARKLLPEVFEEATEDERKEYRDYFMNDIYQKFYDYRDHDVSPKFLLPFLVIDEFIKQGVVSGKPKVQDSTYLETEKRLLNGGKIGFSDKMSIMRGMEDGKSKVMSTAQVEENRMAIKSVFDHLIRNGMDIEDVIKLNNG